MTVTRLYDPYGSYRCQMCRRHPSIGWVYRCTQDHDGFLPEADFTATSKTTTVVVTEQKPVWLLKQWMYEAVLKGQYSVEQFSTLFQQRQGVRNAIFKSNNTATASTSVLSDETGNSADIASTTLNSIASSYSDDSSKLRPCGNEVSYQVKHYDSTLDERLGNVLNISTATARNITSCPSYPACTWTCCQSCRPTYRDRAWLSLNAAVSEPTVAPPLWEFENRRISDSRLVARLGLPKPSVPPQVDDSHYDSSSEAPLSSDGNLAESETDRLAGGGFDGIRIKGSFRKTVRKTLIGAIGHKRGTPGESERSSRDSSHSSLKRLGRSILFRPRRSSQSTIGYNPRPIEDGQLQESLMLMIAANTPLPDAAASVEDLFNREVEVEDGVAVTEEGIGMSAADIIIQV